MASKRASRQTGGRAQKKGSLGSTQSEKLDVVIGGKSSDKPCLSTPQFLHDQPMNLTGFPPHEFVMAVRDNDLNYRKNFTSSSARLVPPVSALLSNFFLGPCSMSRASLFLAGSAFLAFSSAVPVRAQSTTAAVAGIASVGARVYNIGAQPLSAALMQFSQQAGLQVTADSAILRGVKTGGVHGQLTSRQALGQLLAGTGLSYVPSGNGTVVLTKESTNIMLGPVRVGGQYKGPSDPQSAFGPGVGLVATRSASATRTDTPLLEVPKSVYVVTRKQMDDLQPQTITEALRYTPGIVSSTALSSLPDTSNSHDFYQRGFQSDTFIDGLMTGSSSPSMVEPFFMDRVEALSGPSSVMYGQALPGGIVNTVLKRPTEYNRYEANVGFGNYGRYEGQIDASGPLNKQKTLLYRIVGIGETQNSQQNFQKYQRLAGQGDLEWKIDDKTTLTLIGQYSYTPESPVGGTVPLYGSLSTASFGKLSPRNYYGDPGFLEAWDKSYMGEVLLSHEFTKNLQFNSTVRYERDSNMRCRLALNTLNSQTLTISRLASCMGENNAYSVLMTSNVSYKMNTGLVHHHFLVGVDYRDQYSEGRSRMSLTNVPDVSLLNPVYYQYNMSQYMTSINGKMNKNIYGYWQDGIYFQDQIKWKRVRVTLAGRQDWNGYGDIFTRPFTWNAGINYVFDFGLAPYFMYSTSFMPQTGQVYNNQILRQANPLNGSQWEVGLKYQIPYLNSFFSAAYYDVKENNVLVNDPEFPDYNLEIGQQRVRGVELSAHANLAQGLDLVANYTYSHDENSKTNLTATDFNGNTVSLQGKMPTGMPTHTMSVFTDYQFPEHLAPGLSVNFGIRYQNHTWGDQANSFRVPAYVLFDAGLNYNFGKVFKELKGLNLRLSMTNIANSTYIASCGSKNWCSYGEKSRVFGMIGYRW